ncbi:MAG TPA: DUF4037 domain-containing protein [Anaerolineales bacterium]|nr:DUF4037 domain-containing protein [Anaerolineales bacterium]
MADTIEATLQTLVHRLSQHNSIRAIGISGGERPLPKVGEGDIDLFVYCIEIPSRQEREAILLLLPGAIDGVSIGKLESGHWGQGDCFRIEGVETCLLYFTVTEARAELEAILSGKYLGRLDSYYYPIGRCAMWKTMRAYYDPDGFLASLKQRLYEYPEELAVLTIDHHLNALEDVEDLERAVERKDLFFYHFAMDLALDSFLQSLFAINREYFPSRKRSEICIQYFNIKPPKCASRLRQVVAFGGNAETLEQSYEVWKGLINDLRLLANLV